MPTFLLTLLKYWKPIAIGLAIIAVFFAGVRYESATCRVEKLELIAEYTQMIQEEVNRRQQISEIYEQQMAELRSQQREIIREVEVEIKKPIYNECKVPESGIKLLNDTVNKLNNLRKN
jgi:hypothetical protein